MSKADLTVDSLIEKYGGTVGDKGSCLIIPTEEFAPALTTLVENMQRVIIGDDEQTFGEKQTASDGSKVRYSIAGYEFIVPRNQLRQEQRQRAKAELKKRGFTI